ncbi:MAG: epimerase [Anaerolineales bacterium]|nr:SDR family oxidoreductase [Anaerolineae bacterium]PWB52216.1 MAG: epimerase [Anaerolineales bacterium]
MNLITGATGHIGNVLVRMFSERGVKVRAMVMPGEDSSPLNSLDVEIVESDVLDYQSLLKAFSNIEVVYHLAGMISILPGRDDLLRAVNVMGTRNVIEAARSSGVRRLVYTSSIHALQRVPEGILIDETVPFDIEHAISSYDSSKASASLDVLNAVHDGLDAVIVCPTGVIGPYDFRTSEMGQLILDCVEEKTMFYVDGAYDFVDVRDVAQGLILAGERGRCGESYILSGERIAVFDIIKIVQEVIGKRLFSLKIPFSLATFTAKLTPLYYRLTRIKPRFTSYSLATIISNSHISHSKAQRELGYHPRPLRESLSDTVKWIKYQKLIKKAGHKYPVSE